MSVKVDPCKTTYDQIKGNIKPLDDSFNQMIIYLKKIGNEMNKIFPQVAKIFNQLIVQLETGINLPIQTINTYLNDIKNLIKLFIDALNGSITAMLTFYTLPYVMTLWDFLINYSIFGFIDVRKSIYLSMIISTILMVVFVVGSLYNIYKLFQYLLTF